MACMRWRIVALVAFDWVNDIVSIFLQEFLTFQTKVRILKVEAGSLFHCVVFCPIVPSNWFRSMIGFWSIITKFKPSHGILSLFRKVFLFSYFYKSPVEQKSSSCLLIEFTFVKYNDLYINITMMVGIWLVSKLPCFVFFICLLYENPNSNKFEWAIN